jgi:hypothetical protein
MGDIEDAGHVRSGRVEGEHRNIADIDGLDRSLCGCRCQDRAPALCIAASAPKVWVTAASPPAFRKPYFVGLSSVPVKPKDSSASGVQSSSGELSVSVSCGPPVYTETVEIWTHCDTSEQSVLTASNTNWGGNSELEVSITASQGP